MNHIVEQDLISDLSDAEIDSVTGGVFWVAVGALSALGAAAMIAYQAGQKDAQCYIS